jgi:hypothetical protein
MPGTFYGDVDPATRRAERGRAHVRRLAELEAQALFATGEVHDRAVRVLKSFQALRHAGLDAWCSLERAEIAERIREREERAR